MNNNRAKWNDPQKPKKKKSFFVLNDDAKKTINLKRWSPSADLDYREVSPANH